MTPELVLRDIHQPPPPSWWPPAPGWWVIAALVALALLLGLWLWSRHRRRQRAIAALFDDAVQQADSPAAQVAMMSELLRRAARRRHSQAERLRGEDWLRLLDEGLPAPEFSQGPGRLLLEGGFRREVDATDVETLRPLARRKYLDLFAQRKPSGTDKRRRRHAGSDA